MTTRRDMAQAAATSGIRGWFADTVMNLDIAAPSKTPPGTGERKVGNWHEVVC